MLNFKGKKSQWKESNFRSYAYQASALPTKLHCVKILLKKVICVNMSPWEQYMKLQERLKKILTFLIFGFVIFNFVFVGAMEAVIPKNAHFIPRCEDIKTLCLFITIDCVPSAQTKSFELRTYLSNIIFNPFFSLPILFLFLFMIWSKFKAKNSFK